jgi:hypothetical protein
MSYVAVSMARKNVDDGWMSDRESGERKTLRQQVMRMVSGQLPPSASD